MTAMRGSVGANEASVPVIDVPMIDAPSLKVTPLEDTSAAVAEALRLAEAIETLLTDAHGGSARGLSLRLALGLARNLKDELSFAASRLG